MNNFSNFKIHWRIHRHCLHSHCTRQATSSNLLLPRVNSSSG